MKNLDNAVKRKELVKLVADNSDYHMYEVEDMLLSLEKVLRDLLLQDRMIKFGDLFRLTTRTEEPRLRYSAYKKAHYMQGNAKYLYIKPSKRFKRELDESAGRVDTEVAPSTNNSLD